MKRSLLLLIICLSILLCTRAYSQPGSGDCDPLAEIGDDDYCEPVPLDENMVFLIIGGLALGYYKITLDTRVKRASVRQV